MSLKSKKNGSTRNLRNSKGVGGGHNDSDQMSVDGDLKLPPI